IHFLAGLWGALAVGFLALKDNDLLWDGPLKESGDRLGQFWVQVESVVIVGAWTLIGTVIVYYIASALTGGARVDKETEYNGLDESVHGERGMSL
ncbi:MAG TPA: ammonium transporter, partial [Sulfurovum sp.]|nr:ammonium transporter [Sulfurovum sp.]